MNQPSSTGDSALTTTRHKERACGRRRYERITAERIASGMCPRCGKARPAPDRTLCRHCGEKRRKAERARCAKARAAGILYGGRDAERCRRSASDRSKRRDRARREAGLCTRCGKQQPVKGGTVWNRAAWHGVTGSGNNMPRSVPPACAAGAVRRLPMAALAANGAARSRPNAQERRRRTPEAGGVTSTAGCEGFA